MWWRIQLIWSILLQLIPLNNQSLIFVIYLRSRSCWKIHEFGNWIFVTLAVKFVLEIFNLNIEIYSIINKNIISQLQKLLYFIIIIFIMLSPPCLTVLIRFFVLISFSFSLPFSLPFSFKNFKFTFINE